MKKHTFTAAILFLIVSLLSLNGCAIADMKAAQTESAGTSNTQQTDTLFQVSTLKALTQGVYDGALSLGELKQRGDLGIGTFEGLNGEMLILDGTVYQVKADGTVATPKDSILTPFAAITVFGTDQEKAIADIPDYAALKKTLDALLPSQNLFYAFRIDGTFSYIKTRSVPKQQEPYPPLADVTASQPTFEFHNVKGTIIGFWCPAYVEGINLPGYHLHFITADLTAGGHLLECTVESARVLMDTTDEFQMLLPENEHFLKSGFSDVTGAEVQQVEK